MNQIIANREGTSRMNGSHVNGFAQVAKRTGFAIMGALSGLYVGALMARIDIEEINSVGVLFLVILYGSAGFYLGTNLPSLPSGVSRRVLSDSGFETKDESYRAGQRHRHINRRSSGAHVGFHDRA